MNVFYKPKFWGAVFILLLLGFGLVLMGNTYTTPANGGTVNTVDNQETIGNYGELPRLESAEQLRKLLDENGYSADDNYFRFFSGSGGAIMVDAVKEMAPMEAQTEKSMDMDAGTANGEYSELNVQVAGVDEADIVRTDGQYIYRVSRYKERLDIVRAWPVENMEYLGGIDFSDESFSPRELYVDGDQLILIGTAYREMKMGRDLPLQSFTDYWVPEYHQQTCRVLVYDLSALPEIKETRRLELEGSYLSSRKVDDQVYVVANKYLDYYVLEEGQNPNPCVYDSVRGDKFRRVDYKEICYFPIISPNYLITAAFSLNAPEQTADIQTSLGGGEQIYASRDYLYVALNDYEREQGSADRWGAEQITRIFRFALRDAAMIYAGEGSVPGHILNQFSMDEYDGAFRLATTVGYTWGEGEDISKNNVYVLDEELRLCGAVEDIAPGEKIYSARFMGERAYMVTFRTVDPLFVLDLSDPTMPTILGQLKIPGYSDYLHPYDENHIIGFGKNSVTYKEGAYYQGIKIALFDVSDPANPIECCKTEIGDRGTESPLLQDHKALLFAKEKNILAFPVTVMELSAAQRESEAAGGYPQYGDFSFQGAYIYSLDPEVGFTLQQRISHISDEDYRKAGSNWYDSSYNVERILYIGDVLYTISDYAVKASDIKNAYAEIGMVEL